MRSSEVTRSDQGLRRAPLQIDESVAVFGQGVVGQMVKEFAERESFILALVPEGTRGGVARLRTGFWHIAQGAKVPIVCWYLDPINKRTRWVGRLETSESLEHDLQVIRQLYADAGFEIPPDSPPEAEKIPA